MPNQNNVQQQVTVEVHCAEPNEAAAIRAELAHHGAVFNDEPTGLRPRGDVGLIVVAGLAVNVAAAAVASVQLRLAKRQSRARTIRLRIGDVEIENPTSADIASYLEQRDSTA